MIAKECEDGVIPLAPLRWNLLKIERRWQDRICQLDAEAKEETAKLETKHSQQRQALTQNLRSLREATKATIPLNGRLQIMRASCDNLARLGRVEESGKVRRKLDPFEKAFWAKELEKAGITARANRGRDVLLGAQQAELASLRQVLRRDMNGARQARDAEIKVQRRSNRCSSDDVWGIWFAAKSGGTDRLSQILAQSAEKVDERDPDSGWTALHFAARHGKFGAVEVLLGRKAFVGARGPDGRTPLHLAAGWGTYEVCLSLLQAGADKQLFDKGGLTPLHLAECKRRDRIAAVLRNWRPIGLTATQIQGIIDSRVDGDPSPWETEADSEIRAQLRVLEMKEATFGESHPGTRTMLGKLAGLCRSAGRLEDARIHLERLVGHTQSSPTGEVVAFSSPRARRASSTTSQWSPEAPTVIAAPLATALGNLGVVCHELGESDRASALLEASLKSAATHPVASAGMSFHHIREGVSRNLSLHYLSEGRVDEARSLMRTCLETCENNLRLDMPGGDESLELIEPLMLLSYVDMLAGNHTAAAAGASRAHHIADKRWKYHNASNKNQSLGAVEAECACLPLVQSREEIQLTDTVPYLEWIGVQRFVSGSYAESAQFFSKARALVLDRVASTHKEHQSTVLDGCANIDKTNGSGTQSISRAEIRPPAIDDGYLIGKGVAGTGSGRAKLEVTQAKETISEGYAAGNVEFDSEAMRLDRCAAVAICRQGPEAF